MTLAFNSRHPYVKKDSRWIASLSDGTTVFEDHTPDCDRSAWRRLQDYVRQHGLKITNLRLEAYGCFVKLLPYKDETGRPQIEGYWQSSRIGALFGQNVRSEYNWRGIGFVKDGEVNIVWINHQGSITQEVRELKPDDPAVIMNEGSEDV